MKSILKPTLFQDQLNNQAAIKEINKCYRFICKFRSNFLSQKIIQDLKNLIQRKPVIITYNKKFD